MVFFTAAVAVLWLSKMPLLYSIQYSTNAVIMNTPNLLQNAPPATWTSFLVFGATLLYALDLRQFFMCDFSFTNYSFDLNSDEAFILQASLPRIGDSSLRVRWWPLLFLHHLRTVRRWACDTVVMPDGSCTSQLESYDERICAWIIDSCSPFMPWPWP